MSSKYPKSYGASTTDYSEYQFQPNNFQTRESTIPGQQPMNQQGPSFAQQDMRHESFTREPIHLSNQKHNQQPQRNYQIPQQSQQMPYQQQPYQQQSQPPQQSYSQTRDTYTMLPQVFQMDQDFLPSEILFLLSEEDNHVTRFKAKVEREKAKVKKDVESIKVEIVNMMDDLSVQMTQFIDEHYMRYINVYAMFKEEVIQFKQAKLEAPLNLVAPPPATNFEQCSNANLIRDLEEMRYKNYVSKVNQYVGELAKIRVEKIQTISKDLLQLTSNDSNLYNSDATLKQLEAMRLYIEEQLITKFGNMTDYIQPLDFLLQKKINQEVKKHPYLENTSLNNSQNSGIKSQQSTQSLDQPLRIAQPYAATMPISHNSKLKPIVINSHTISTKVDELQESTSLMAQNQAMMLCFTHLKDNLVATGHKNAIINIWDNQKLITQLNGHNGGVCTLATIKLQGSPYFLASGSDHGDNSVKIWNLSQFSDHNTLVGHSAAVVALLSLDDGQTLVSGSYDKSILVWNIDQQNPLQKLTVHTNAVTSLALCKSRFVSGGLDCAINVWKINFKGNGIFESAYLERTIKNSSLVCALNTIDIINKQYVISGGKDGKIREYDITSGDCVNCYQVSLNPIVEMIVVNQQSHYGVISLSNKDRNLIYTSQGQNTVLDANDQVHIEFGCGVYPKMEVVNKNGTLNLLIVSQQQDNPRVISYEL